MAIITQIRLGAAKTINMGNYQSLRIEAGVTADLVEGDDTNAVTVRLQAELSELMAETYRAQRKDGMPDAEPPPAKLTGNTW